MIPEFDADGLLPPGDYPLTFEQLRGSMLVAGPPDRPGWDRCWRARLVDNLEILTRQLWQVGVRNVFIGGSFVMAVDRPNDLDGYFDSHGLVRSWAEVVRILNLLDPHKVWTWANDRRVAYPEKGEKLPMWHQYRVELYPNFGQIVTGFVDNQGNDVDYPAMFRRTRVHRATRGYHGGRAMGIVKVVGCPDP
jgi:hypothetical protein